ncbi:MAG: XisI protein [Anaerolineae bacterium]|nr:XisI protein [Anaerolineae bacterium]
MDNLNNLDFYRKAIETVIQDHAQRPSNGDIQSELIVDAAKRHYEVMFVGWDGMRRVHGSVLHIDLIGDKIWIQHDGTAPGVALELVEAGVPKDKIVLGFRPKHIREMMGYAVE